MTNRSKVLTIILAGGKGSRLGLLSEERAKPAIPFGGNYRLIDFVLSNCAHSRLPDIWVIEQYKLQSLNEHLSNGRPWDLDRTRGGLQILPPFEDSEGEGFAEGNADAISLQLKFIKDFGADLIVVLSADHLYKIDFRDVINAHLEKKAHLTMVTTKVPPGESASRFGVVKADKDGRVTEFAYKPEKPSSDVVTTEIFVYNAAELYKAFAHLEKEVGRVKDFGHELVPHFVKNEKAFEFRHKSYWRDVGTVESYFAANMDLLDEKGDKVDLEDSEWLFLTRGEQRHPAFFGSESKVSASLVANGAKVYGSIEKCIVFGGAVIEKGAKLKNCIVLPDALIAGDCRLERAIVDERARVSAERLKKHHKKTDSDDILVVGRRRIQTAKQIADENKQ